ncbi:uncharacterized protein LOC113648637 [Tachysurus fulvidraco]|uniref:uncharacterized protein LOC113648637 n=1 Tax=Tachysurus fulvidraco TaxID=1234273 RepID=UPI001FF0354F|nr:uncharacterized protein LOC113648637 [Tachysurus fulvidraco]
MSHIKQKQPHSSAPKTTRATASIAGKLAAIAATSNLEKQTKTETFESVSMDQLISELTKQRISIRENISDLIRESIGPLQSSVNALKETVDGFQSHLAATESLAGENFEKLAVAENTIKTLQAQNISLFDRVEDLEMRLRRADLRIVNVPEGSENGHDPVTFIAEMLLEMTGTEVFDKPPALERAHRSPGQKPADGRKPRPFVVCFHRFQEKEQLLRWSR